MIRRIALMVWMAQAIAHGSEAPRKVTVCLRGDTADRELFRIGPLAQVLAARIFAETGISLKWRDCKPADESSQATIVMELVARTPENVVGGVLGQATPNRGHIKVFLDRIEAMECPETVLGHVMAHELAHVVQGFCRHSESGLMKAHWTRRDLVGMRYKPLLFTAEDLILLNRGLAMRCESTDTPVVAR